MAITSVSTNTVNGVDTNTKLNHAILDVYSLDILHKAQGVMRFEEFAIRKQEFTAAPGEKINFIIYDDLELGTAKGKLTESDSLTSNAMVATQATITIEEWGKAIKVSEKLLRLSWDDVMAEAATLLGRDYAVVRDIALRDAIATQAGNALYADVVTTDANTPTTPATLEAEDVMDTNLIRKAVEALETNNAPKFYGDYYICFVHPHQASDLRRDSNWINANAYAGTRNIFNGEIGRWEDVVFITSTHCRNGAAATNAPGYLADFDVTIHGGNVDAYEALMFGDQCLYVADALPVELRDNGIEDFGRTHGLAWYSLFGTKCLRPDYAVNLRTA